MGRHSRDDGDDAGQETPTNDVGYRDLGFARLDTDRAARTGDPEVVHGADKTTDQVVTLVLELLLAASGRPAIVTRASPEMLAALAEEYDQVEIDELARCAAVGPLPPTRGRVGVLSAGTSDRFVAAEAAFIARASGAEVEVITDVGIAGIHRLLAVRNQLESMDCLIVVAGMDGALPSAVGGLTGVPLIAVPTSVGYGASLGGIAALLTMLNSCAPGVLVCNIDNGFGAGLAAARIARRAAEPPKRKRRRRARRRGPADDATTTEPTTDPPAAPVEVRPAATPLPSPRAPTSAPVPMMLVPPAHQPRNVANTPPPASMRLPSVVRAQPEPWHAQVLPDWRREPLADSGLRLLDQTMNPGGGGAAPTSEDTQYGLPW